MTSIERAEGISHRPDERGRFAAFGGRYVPETVIAALDELETAMERAFADPAFHAERSLLLRDYVGRETPIYHAARLSEATGGAAIWFKREDLNHTGAHKINNAIGQALIARRLGKRRIVAETGAGQHGVATATVCALFGLDAVVYMGEEDIRRQAPNVTRMRLLGAEVVPVRSGAGTLKDAMNEAIRDWIATVETTHYMIGSAAGPHPYPLLVRELQRVIGDEARAQFSQRTGALPDVVVACVGGGSNAIGMFHAFRDDAGVRLVGVEAGGDGAALHARSIGDGRISILHGSRSYVLADSDGQVQATHSISAGLDYPGVGPEHSQLAESGRVEYLAETDADALAAFHDVCRLEGIIPALESSHAVARARRLAVELGPERTVLVCLSGRGDKDVQSVLDADAAAGGAAR